MTESEMFETTQTVTVLFIGTNNLALNFLAKHYKQEKEEVIIKAVQLLCDRTSGVYERDKLLWDNSKSMKEENRL